MASSAKAPGRAQVPKGENAHVVVVGAGMGGLAAAIDLARSGLRVTLLERAEAPGGKVRALDVAGRQIDTGPTVFTMRWLFEALFNDAGASLDERLGLQPLEVLARHGWVGSDPLDLYADVERTVAAIDAFAGGTEADAYRRFAARSEAIFETLDHSFMRRSQPGPVALPLSMGLGGPRRLLATRPFTTLWRELGRCFRDPRLRQLFGRYATYCGSSPWAAPATLMLIAHAERAGVWTVKGGMPRLAQALHELAQEQGVTTRFGEGVARLDVAGRSVRGVVTDSGEKIPADAVVFNGDVVALENGLLGDEARQALPRRTGPRSLSAVTWSLVARPRGFPLHHHTVLFGTDYRDEFDAIFHRGAVTAQPTVYLCAQDRHDGSAPRPEVGQPASERVFLLVNAPPKPMDESMAAEIEARTFAFLSDHGLEFDIEARQRLTPNEWAERFPGSAGAIYGWPTHGWRGSFQRAGARGRISGLYFAGGTVHPGPGIPMALQSGRIAASEALGDLGRRSVD